MKKREGLIYGKKIRGQKPRLLGEPKRKKKKLNLGNQKRKRQKKRRNMRRERKRRNCMKLKEIKRLLSVFGSY